jgi:hypothetical protein
MVRYKTKEARAEENAALIRAVFEELRTRAPGGLRYASYRLPDGVSFEDRLASVERVDEDGVEVVLQRPGVGQYLFTRQARDPHLANLAPAGHCHS